MKILIFGSTGQDGSLLCDILSSEKTCFGSHKIICPIRSIKAIHEKSYLHNLYVKDNVSYFECDYSESSIKHIVESVKADVIINFVAVSNVFSPWSKIDETFRVNTCVPCTVIDCLVSNSFKSKFIQASSSLVFGAGVIETCNEETLRLPLYPYGISKNMVDMLIKQAREKFDINASSAIFFNHESERRSDNFLTRKVVLAAKRISEGSKEKLKVGNIDVCRDMGSAKNFMQAVRLMIDDCGSEDYVIGTGKLTDIRSVIQQVFLHYELDYQDHIVTDSNLIRSYDTNIIKADIMKAERRLLWSPKDFTINDIIC